MAAAGTMTWRRRAAGARAFALSGVAGEAAVLALALPLLFIHARYQPTIHLGLSSTTVGIQLADFAVLAIVVAGLVAGVRRGFAPLRRGGVLWGALAVYFVWVGIEILIPHGTAGYPTSKHAVTAAKFLEYAFIAPAVVLVVRRGVEAKLVVLVLTAWSVLASAVGVVQFFGANIFVSGATGGRQLSFLGFHDFASLSAAVLLGGVIAIALPRLELHARVGWTALVSGAVGVVLSAALAAVIGIGLAGAALLVVAYLRSELWPRRIAAVGIVVGLAVVGALAMRGTDLGRYVGLTHPAGQKSVESYSQRTLLAWIGWRMFRDHPLAGLGWEASGDPSRFEPYLPAARRRFASQPPIAFPSPQHRWGVQNFYVQHLADLGATGLLLLLAVFVSGARLGALGVRSEPALAAVLGLAWIMAVGGLWIAQGIVAGLPLDALTWLSFGLAARG
jgi:O-antigen ligase/polysaccharide polymerase Wzy-like membrane protein